MMDFYEGGKRKKAKTSKAKKGKKQVAKKGKKKTTKGKKKTAICKQPTQNQQMMPWDELLYGATPGGIVPAQFRENQLYGTQYDPMFGMSMGDSRLFSGFPMETASIFGTPSFVIDHGQKREKARTDNPGVNALYDRYIKAQKGEDVSASSHGNVPDHLKSTQMTGLDDIREQVGQGGGTTYYSKDVFDGDEDVDYKEGVRNYLLKPLDKTPGFQYDNIPKAKLEDYPSTIELDTILHEAGAKKRRRPKSAPPAKRSKSVKPKKKTQKKKGGGYKGMKPFPEMFFG